MCSLLMLSKLCTSSIDDLGRTFTTKIAHIKPPHCFEDLRKVRTYLTKITYARRLYKMCINGKEPDVGREPSISYRVV